MSTPCSISYLFTNKSVHICSAYFLAFNLSHEVARIFFFLQALAGIFFSSSIPCMIFFLDLTLPLPGYLMVHPLTVFVDDVLSTICLFRKL